MPTRPRGKTKAATLHVQALDFAFAFAFDLGRLAGCWPASASASASLASSAGCSGACALGLLRFDDFFWLCKRAVAVFSSHDFHTPAAV